MLANTVPALALPMIVERATRRRTRAQLDSMRCRLALMYSRTRIAGPPHFLKHQRTCSSPGAVMWRLYCIVYSPISTLHSPLSTLHSLPRRRGMKGFDMSLLGIHQSVRSTGGPAPNPRGAPRANGDACDSCEQHSTDDCAHSDHSNGPRSQILQQRMRSVRMS